MPSPETNDTLETSTKFSWKREKEFKIINHFLYIFYIYSHKPIKFIVIIKVGIIYVHRKFDCCSPKTKLAIQVLAF